MSYATYTRYELLGTFRNRRFFLFVWGWNALDGCAHRERTGTRLEARAYVRDTRRV
jgi:hypothetical protein